MPADFLDAALHVAQRAADAAAAVIMARYAAQDFSVTTKEDSSPVTEADREAEQVIKQVLREAFPGHAFLGEEFGREGESRYLWLIDPIDGTKSFVRGYPMFSTQIALMVDGELVLGVSDASAYGERAWAVRGGGAFLRRQQGSCVALKVSAAAEFAPATAVSTGNLMLSFSHMGMRFFANLVPAYDQRSAEKWGILEYLRWGFSLGAQTMVWLAYLYGLLAWKAAVVGSRLRHPLEEDARRGRHEAING